MRTQYITLLALLTGCAPAVAADAASVAPTQLDGTHVQIRAAPIPAPIEVVAFGSEQRLDLDIRTLCEPTAGRWPWPTTSEQDAMKLVIEATCAAMGVDEESCKYFKLVSFRESSGRSWARHKLAGDVAASIDGYLYAASVYGWDARWAYEHRETGDLTQMVLTQERVDANPYFVDVERWVTGGLGLGGVNVVFHLAKFDINAPPEILCDPVINVMTQIIIARTAQDRYQAKNAYQVQAVYAGRTVVDGDGHAVALSCATGCPSNTLSQGERDMAARGDARMRSRCRTWGMDCAAELNLGRVLRGSSVAERYQLADEIRGAALRPFDEPIAFDDALPVVIGSEMVPNGDVE